MGFFSNLKRSYQERQFKKKGVEVYNREQPKSSGFIGSDYKGKFKQAASSAGTAVGSGLAGARSGAVAFRNRVQNASDWYAQKQRSYREAQLQKLQFDAQAAGYRNTIARKNAAAAKYQQQYGGGGLNALFGGSAPVHGKGRRQPQNPLASLNSFMNTGTYGSKPKPFKQHKKRRRYGGGRVIIVR